MMWTTGKTIAIATGAVVLASTALLHPFDRPESPILLLIGAISQSCESGDCADDESRKRPPLNIATAYLACSELATQRVLTSSEAHECGLNYIQLKLSFLPQVSIEEFIAMSPVQRFEENRMGYLLYLRWKKEDSQFFEHLRKLAGSGSSVPG